MEQLSFEAEVFFTRLIMKADDFGCFHAHPKLLKSALFPLKEFTDDQVTGWLNECKVVGIVKVYKSDGRDYLQIDDFGQRLRAMSSKFPQPVSTARTIDSNKPPETKRNETEEETETEEESGRFLVFGAKKDFSISVKTVYTTDKPKIIYDLKVFFSEEQLSQFEKNKWIRFDEFMKENAGRVFDDDSHVYNTFRQFHKPNNNLKDGKKPNTNSAEILDPNKSYRGAW